MVRNKMCLCLLLLAFALSRPHIVSAAAEGVDHETAIRSLMERQIKAFESYDFSIGAGDWVPGTEVISPEGRTPFSDLPAGTKDYGKYFRNLKVTIARILVSADGNHAAIEWDWGVTRRRDGARSVTHEAILIDLEGGKINGWREYWDLSKAVDAAP